MAIIGNPIVSTNYVTDSFSGDDSTVAFSLSQAPASAQSIAVYISGLYQIPNSAYTVSGSTITFTSAPPTGTNNITVLYLGLKNQNLVPVNGSINPEMLSNANVIFWSAANNNVGIGTTSPSSKLDVVGTGKFTGLTEFTNAINLTTSTLNYVYFNDALAFAKNGTGTRLTIDSSGNVGVGTGSPSVKLDVVGTSRYTFNVANAYTLQTSINAAGSAFANDYKNALSHIWQTSGTECMRIDSSGNVGIGTSSPTGKFHVEGGTENAIIGSSTRKLYFRADSSGVMIGTGAVQTGTGFYFNDASNYIYAQTNSTERMRIDSSGNLLFNSGYGSVATAYGCRAWVNFNGTGTVAIRASGNVSSITDGGTGNYTVNLSTALVDANYSVTTAIKPTSGASSRNGKVANIKYDVNLSTTSFTLWCYSTAGDEDYEIVSAQVVR